MGARLDEHGIACSSVTYLKRLPAENSKFAQSLVRRMLEVPDNRGVVRGVIGLATAIRRKVLAEGVEGELVVAARNRRSSRSVLGQARSCHSAGPNQGDCLRVHSLPFKSRRIERLLTTKQATGALSSPVATFTTPACNNLRRRSPWW
jgi:predicted signal transduction protein with EAL and GGDEF domain